MSRRHLFHEADLERAIRVVQRNGVAVGRVEIDAEGRIVIVSRSPSPDEGDGRQAAKASLEALRERLSRDRVERAASRQGKAGGRP